jgi:ABC-type amino acid transport substrate-binding protein
VGTVRGYISPKEFTAADINTVESSDDEINVSAMLHGRYGFVLIDKNLGFYQAKKAGKGDDVEWVVTLENFPLYNGIMKNGPKDWKKLLNDFNKGLDIIKKNGTFAKVMEEYSLK